jgi:SAM-dependent methyltransferase
VSTTIDHRHEQAGTGARPGDAARLVAPPREPASARAATRDLAAMPSGLRRSVELFALFRREQTDPDAFYTFLAADTVVELARHRDLRGARAIDIGGGAGYMADALRAQGASCCLLEYDHAEMHGHGRTPDRAVRGDAMCLPVRSGSLDVVHSSNVLEHVVDPAAMLAEMVRVLVPGTGVGYVAFPNWWSPWGGHETAPWHWLNKRYSVERYIRRHGHRPKNEIGVSLFAVHIHQIRSWFRSRPDVEVLWSGPRYYPRWAQPVVRVPVAREVLTWNLCTVFRRRPDAAVGTSKAT